VPTGLVREVPGVALVLAVDEMEPDLAGGSLPLAKRSCGGSALWCSAYALRRRKNRV
jgi:hypothetical protein